jgi:cellulose synthase operon protein C
VRPSSLALICFFALSVMASVPAQGAVWPSAVLRAERELHSPDVDVRRRAAQSLRELPASSSARLARAALDDADVEVRLAALEACLSVGVPGLGDRLVPWLSDAERRLRLAAAEALSQSPSARAVPSLGRALGDADVTVRSAAAGALGKSGSPEAVLALLGHLDDAAPEVRRVVALALGDLGDTRAVVPLIGKIQDSRPTVREGVAQALAQLADVRSVSALILSLRDADDSVKIAALGALSRIGDPSAVPSISALLRTGSDAVVPAALDALSQLRTPAATKALIDELATDRPGEARAAVVQALGRSGRAALPALEACLSAESDPERLSGCALAIGQSHQLEGVTPIQDALRRGALRPLPALLALSDLRAPESLPTVLEYLSDSDVLVRRAARLAAKALLDPRHPDGRAVEPLEHALQRSTRDRVEQAELLDLLGQTGSPRAARSLLPFAGRSDDVSLRAHALSALGRLGEAGQVPTLLIALDDDAGGVRLAAALAIGRLRLQGRTQELLDRLERSSEQARPLLLFALGGAVSQERDPKVAQRLAGLVSRARDGERDALIELLGRMPSADAVARLAALSGSSSLPADRAKFAEALAAHPAERARLVPLLRDSNAAVRANAAWSLAEVGSSAERPALEAALNDNDVAVAGNALQALARITARAHGSLTALACPRLSDPRSSQRALSLRALRLTAERCEHGEDVNALARDRSAFVRQSAAALLRDVSRGPADEVALSRARDRDPSGAVAAESELSVTLEPDSVEPTQVVVIPAGEDVPRPAQPFALLRADGLVRLGVSDRRGQLFEVAAPCGVLSLLEPATDLE